MIRIENIKKSFGDKEILKGISGTFEKGKTNLIIGTSGTGKSVLLKSMVGLVKPDEGDVLYNDRDFVRGGRAIQTEVRREMGMLFQGSALFDSMSVLNNVIFPLDMLSDMNAAEKKERAEFCLERVGLENVGHLKPSEISGGMAKRVGIARAIVLKPRYLFCDEPNSGLDPLTAIKIDELIAEITHELDITTIIVTHDMNSVMGIGAYIMYLNSGRKLWEGSKDEILDTQVPELQEFIFSSALVKALKPKS